VRDYILLTGMVLQAQPIGEYDKRMVILTKERGKITAFARGARRQNSRLMAGTNPFSFGMFKVYEGKAYNLIEVDINQYFEELRNDFDAACMGMYFLEYANYYTRENNDEKEMLKLLYQSLRAITVPSIVNELVRYIFEIKAMVVNGEFPGIPENRTISEGTRHTINYIVLSSIEKLYTFTVSQEVLSEIKLMSDYYRMKYIDKHFNSLEILEKCMLKN
jgi:DNA repair protein RecO (recombination protein O)